MSRRLITTLSIAGLACVTTPAVPSPRATSSESEVAIEEIAGPVQPPGPRVIDAAGRRQLGASADELMAAGHYFYRRGELDRAEEFYRACAGRSDGELWATCQWGLGAVLVTRARGEIAEGLHEAEDCVRRDPPAPLECTEEASSLRHALIVLRSAFRRHPTARRALVIGTLYEVIGSDAQALEFYEQGSVTDPDDDSLSRAAARLRSRGPRPECPSCPPQAGVEPRPPPPPADCPELPFGWHRRTGELAVVGSGIEGITRERASACFGEGRDASAETWTYTRGECTSTLADGESPRSVTFVVRLYFEGDVVESVTHERIIHDRECPLSWE